MNKLFLMLASVIFFASTSFASSERCFYLYRDENLKQPTQELLKVSEYLDILGIYAQIELRQANYVMVYGERTVITYSGFRRYNQTSSGNQRKYIYRGEFESPKRTAFGKEIKIDFYFVKKVLVDGVESGSVEIGNSSLFYKEIECLKADAK